MKKQIEGNGPMAEKHLETVLGAIRRRHHIADDIIQRYEGLKLSSMLKAYHRWLGERRVS
ncbi:MAG TPA: hypothetical protein VK145_03095 [Candidatus Nanoarchaeia archaeon]|nr:hypothetical protein [Candidatus Nanoarchaeia archaeon]